MGLGAGAGGEWAVRERFPEEDTGNLVSSPNYGPCFHSKSGTNTKTGFTKPGHASKLPGSSLKIQLPEPNSEPTELASLVLGPRCLYVCKSPQGF